MARLLARAALLGLRLGPALELELRVQRLNPALGCAGSRSVAFFMPFTASLRCGDVMLSLCLLLSGLGCCLCWQRTGSKVWWAGRAE